MNIDWAVFWNNVDFQGPDGCWIWTGSRFPNNYGRVYTDKKRDEGAHRLAYEFIVGPIELGKVIMHLCDNPPCVNPDHLQQGTHQQNMADMRQKGRWVSKSPAWGERHGCVKLTTVQVLAILRDANKTPQRRLAKRYGVSQATIWRIRRGVQWSHITQMERAA